MTAILKTILFEEFVSIDVTGFRALTERERLEVSGRSGIVLEYQVLLKVEATATIQSTLQQGLSSGVTTESVSILSLRVGGK